MINLNKPSRRKPLKKGAKNIKREGDRPGRGRSVNAVMQKRFLALYIKHHGNKSRAAKECGIQVDTVFRWFRSDPTFREQADLALEEYYDELWKALVKRGLEKSDTAAMFLLKERYPERYDDAIRKAVYLQKNQIADPEKTAGPTQIIFVRQPEQQPEDNIPLLDDDIR